MADDVSTIRVQSILNIVVVYYVNMKCSSWKALSIPILDPAEVALIASAIFPRQTVRVCIVERQRLQIETLTIDIVRSLLTLHAPILYLLLTERLIVHTSTIG